MIGAEKGLSRDAGQKQERRGAAMKKLWIMLVILGVMMGTAWSTCAAGAEELDVAVIRGRVGQYRVVAHFEPRLDVAVIRARQTQYTEAAYTEPRLDIVVVRGRQGLTSEAASPGEPRLDIIVIRAQQY
jgi:hypothetical protein